MRSLIRLVPLLYWPLATPALAQNSAQQLLKTVGSIRCEFPHGYIVNLATDPHQRHTAAGATVVYDAIDRTQGHARLIGTAGTGDVQVIVGNNTFTLVEMVPAGTPMITTVYGQFRPGTDELLAVTSRHFGYIGPPAQVVVAQYYGSCRRFE